MSNMFYTLDRIEDLNIAVLISDDGNKYDIPSDMLPENYGVGSVFEKSGDGFIFNENETDRRKRRVQEKSRRLFDKLKNRQRGENI